MASGQMAAGAGAPGDYVPGARTAEGKAGDRQPKIVAKSSFAPLFRFFALKIASAIPLVLGVITVNFLLIHMAPGDPISVLIGEMSPSAEQMAALRAKFG